MAHLPSRSKSLASPSVNLPINRRSALGLGVLTLSSLSLAACQTGSTSDPSAGRTAEQADEDLFPRTIEHVHGTTTIEASPQRVATVSWVNHDVVVALGMVPVGVPKTEFGGNDNGSTDWFDAALDELIQDSGGEEPTRYSEGDGVDFQAIAALEPDIILGVYSGMSEEDYTKLSEIAPTIAYPKKFPAYGTPWQETTKIVGKALGLDDKAQEVVSQVEKEIDEAASQHPEIQGKTFLYGTVDPSSGEEVTIYTQVDNRPRFLMELGMEQAPVIKEEAGDDPKSFSVSFSPERADELVSDVLVTWAADEGTAQKLKSDKLLGKIPAIADDHFLLQSDDQETLSISASSPLSLPWALDFFVPELAAAVTGSGKQG